MYGIQASINQLLLTIVVLFFILIFQNPKQRSSNYSVSICVTNKNITRDAKFHGHFRHVMNHTIKKYF